MKYYHYTTYEKLELILKDGEIKQAKAYISENENPFAWVSTHPHFEPTALKAYKPKNGEVRILTFQEQLEMAGCVRIEIKPTFKLHNWTEIQKLSNTPKLINKALESTGIERGANPNDWYGSLVPIPITEWVGVEVYSNKWKPMITL